MKYGQLESGDLLAATGAFANASPDTQIWLHDPSIDKIELVMSVELGSIKMSGDGLVVYDVGDEDYHVYTLQNGKPKLRLRRKSALISKNVSVFRKGTKIWPQANTHA